MTGHGSEFGGHAAETVGHAPPKYASWHWTNSETGEERGSIGVSVTADNVRLSFTLDDQPVVQHVPLVRTACNYGGTRPWFRCPRCYARAAVLFLRSGPFRCRKCSGVVYSSQAEDDIGRAWRRQSKLETRLDENWQRPKGMHESTRDRIVDQIIECEERRELALAGFLLRMEARIGKLGGILGL